MWNGLAALALIASQAFGAPPHAAPLPTLVPLRLTLCDEAGDPIEGVRVREQVASPDDAAGALVGMSDVTGACELALQEEGVIDVVATRLGHATLRARALAAGTASERLELLPDGGVKYGLRHAWSDGTTAVIMEPVDFVARLATERDLPGGCTSTREPDRAMMNCRGSWFECPIRLTMEGDMDFGRARPPASS